MAAALTAALDTWPVDVRPKVHLSEPAHRVPVRRRPAAAATPRSAARTSSARGISSRFSTRPTGRWTSWSRRRRRISRCALGPPGSRPANGKGGLAPRRRRRARSSPARRRAFVNNGGIPAWPRAGVVAVDEVRERVERDVLGQCHSDRDLLLAVRDSLPHSIEREPEERAFAAWIAKPTGQASRPRERLAEQEDVGVVAAEEPPIDRLQQAPHRRGDSARRG